jgi:hypothetical protein
LIIEALGAVQLWLNKEPNGTEPVRVRYRDKTYLLDADALKETFGGD